MGTLAGAREGDWKCGGCGNRNYAFRSICNRCKQARLLVDSQTPADSKWLPRIGDWICAGCSNNNYSSREKCNKCGQPKEAGALTPQAISIPPVTAAGLAIGMNMGMGMGMGMPMNIPNAMGMAWPWSSDGIGGMSGGVPPGGGFRAGDWICTCGFHNYSSRLTCKQCHTPSAAVAAASVASLSSMQNYSFSAHGNKRLATEDAGAEWAKKRLNMGGDMAVHHQYLQQQQLAFGGLDGGGNFFSGPGLNVAAMGGTGMHMASALQVPNLVMQPSLLGKGAKQWRVGDWMCSRCSNHNFASRNTCNSKDVTDYYIVHGAATDMYL